MPRIWLTDARNPTSRKCLDQHVFGRKPRIHQPFLTPTRAATGWRKSRSDFGTGRQPRFPAKPSQKKGAPAVSRRSPNPSQGGRRATMLILKSRLRDWGAPHLEMRVSSLDPDQAHDFRHDRALMHLKIEYPSRDGEIKAGLDAGTRQHTSSGSTTSQARL